ncbi:NADP-dependent oxidoreductase [Chryseobacterium luteum]|uniref:NADPH quinone reductase n=1 Tax=Chryseobacterium luteum TaxID=421531 RepID=A0A085ZEB6_9FLAO|nr:NADP-dependent oxidoreductase [Chryseobacterium luteum]KFF02780.1 NADPH quinone reductase [Chryseobacterium luteum]
MITIQYTAFGHSDVLQLNPMDKPTIQENEVLIKIASTTINPLEMKIREGYLQQAMPITFPYTPGSDVAGIVEAVGNNVSRIKAGDKVYATTYGGTYAEYISLNEDQVAIIPSNISLNEAAALAIPLTTAYTLLVEAGQLQDGQKVLIHGASGGVGSIMVQMAKAMGAYVIGTTSGAELDRVKALGADEVMDYKTQDFTAMVKDIDIVADLVGGETQTKSFEVLKKGGKLISTVMPPSAELAEKYQVEAPFIMSNPSYKKLDFFNELIAQGKIKAQISKTMKLEQAAEAQDLVSKGGVNGKIVLEIN